MTKSMTLAEHQAAQRGETDAETVAVTNPLAELAEQMVRERSQTEGPTREAIAEQLQALGVLETVDPHMALGEIKGRVREAAEAAGVLADYDLISAEAERIWTHYGDTRRASEATYTVSPDGLVNGYEVHASNGDPAKLGSGCVPAQELPGVEPKPLKVPGSSAFDDDGWADSNALANRALGLIERHPDELDHLRGVSIAYLWKLKGGKSRGRPVMGQCVKAGGLLKHYTSAVWLIWLAADNVLAAGYGDREIEALLFRQLLHAGVSEVDEDTGRGGGPAYQPHDVAVFEAELRVYGLWERSLKAVAPAFQQASLFDSEERAVEEELDREEAAQAGYVENPLSGAGQLIHPDGTPLSAEEIAELEAAELRDDPSPEDLDDDDREIGPLGRSSDIDVDSLGDDGQ